MQDYFLRLQDEDEEGTEKEEGKEEGKKEESEGEE